MNQRLIDRINEDEIARRKMATLPFRLLGGFVIMASLGMVGMIIGGDLCSAMFVAVGCVITAALVVPAYGGAP